MKIGNNKITRRIFRISSGNKFFLVSLRIRNRKKLLTFNINSYLCTTLLTPLKEIRRNFGSIECVRYNRVNGAQKHWLFSCSASRNIFI